MTVRKRDIALAPRLTAYVTREEGAAELRISPGTWDEWVKEGRLPPAAPGFPETTPRWRWADVDEKMSGGRKNNDEAKMIAAAKNFAHGATKERKRAVA